MRFAATPPTQDQVRSIEDTQANLNTLAQFFFTGAGTPVGQVAAPVGSVFLRRDGGTGTVLYVKESGGSTTAGWIGK